LSSADWDSSGVVRRIISDSLRAPCLRAVFAPLGRGARALLGWRQADLAKKSGVAEITISNTSEALAMRAVPRWLPSKLHSTKAGVIFLDPGDTRDGGEGVRLKKSTLPVPIRCQFAFFAVAFRQKLPEKQIRANCGERQRGGYFFLGKAKDRLPLNPLRPRRPGPPPVGRPAPGTASRRRSRS
jgi:hypothetical protein